MIQVGAYEAKTHLSSLLEKVVEGDEIIITRHQTPIAKLVPVDTTRNTPVSSLIKKVKKFRQGKILKDVSIKEFIMEGRK